MIAAPLGATASIDCGRPAAYPSFCRAPKPPPGGAIATYTPECSLCVPAATVPSS